MSGATSEGWCMIGAKGFRGMKDSEVQGEPVERHLGSLEARVMRVLWETPNLTVRDVAQRLPGRRQRAYTTVMTVMNRLYEKGQGSVLAEAQPF